MTRDEMLAELKDFSAITRKSFVEMVDKYDIPYDKATEFVSNTKAYNERVERMYNAEVKRLQREWKKLPSVQHSKVFTDDSGKITEEGLNSRRRYVDNMLSDIIPRNKKSILLSDYQLKQQGFDFYAKTRKGMADEDYLDERTQMYFDNYKKALQLHQEKAKGYLDAYDMLSNSEKRKFAKYAEGHIAYQYIQKNEEDYVQYIEQINEVHKFTEDEKWRILHYTKDTYGEGAYYDLYNVLKPTDNRTND